MMISRRNAVSQVIGFMSIENGLILAATGAKGMPLVVEISVAFSILVAFIVIGIFLFRIRERFETVDIHLLHEHPRRAADESAGVLVARPPILVLPALAQPSLALISGLPQTARLNVLASRSLTFVCALLLLIERPAPGPYSDRRRPERRCSSSSAPWSASPPPCSARATSRTSWRSAT